MTEMNPTKILLLAIPWLSLSCGLSSALAEEHPLAGFQLFTPAFSGIGPNSVENVAKIFAGGIFGNQDPQATRRSFPLPGKLAQGCPNDRRHRSTGQERLLLDQSLGSAHRRPAAAVATVYFVLAFVGSRLAFLFQLRLGQRACIPHRPRQ